jgi:hypothetical protein
MTLLHDETIPLMMRWGLARLGCLQSRARHCSLWTESHETGSFEIWDWPTSLRRVRRWLYEWLPCLHCRCYPTPPQCCRSQCHLRPSAWEMNGLDGLDWMRFVCVQPMDRSSGGCGVDRNVGQRLLFNMPNHATPHQTTPPTPHPSPQAAEVRTPLSRE